MTVHREDSSATNPADSHATPPTLTQVLDLLNELYPNELAVDWDKQGLAIGDLQAPVTKIYFALDAITETIEDALSWGADLIFTHHPFLFSPLESVTSTHDRGHNALRLIRGNCALFSAHTNGDSARGGVNEVLAMTLGVRQTVPMDPHANHEHLGLGRVGELPVETSLRDFADTVARVLPATAQGVRVAGNPNKMVKRVAVLGGSGGSMLNDAVKHDVDVYLTSDLKHHDLLDFQEAQRNRYMSQGLSFEEANDAMMAVVDVAHYASESPWLQVAARTVEVSLKSQGFAVETLVSDISTDPWTFSPARG